MSVTLNIHMCPVGNRVLSVLHCNLCPFYLTSSSVHLLVVSRPPLRRRATAQTPRSRTATVSVTLNVHVWLRCNRVLCVVHCNLDPFHLQRICCGILQILPCRCQPSRNLSPRARYFLELHLQVPLDRSQAQRLQQESMSSVDECTSASMAPLLPLALTH